MQSNETMMDVAAEIRDAIKELTKELREVRVALNSTVRQALIAGKCDL